MIKVGDTYKISPVSFRYRVESITDNLMQLYCIENTITYPYPINDATLGEIESSWILCEPDYKEGALFV